MSHKPNQRWSVARALVFGSIQLAAVIGIVAGTITLSNYMKDNQPERVQVEADLFVPVIQTHIVETYSRVIPIVKTGSVEPSVYVSMTPGVSGVVEMVAPGLGNGAFFDAGEVLFGIAREDLEIEVSRREADRAGARASLDIELAQGENARREWDSFGRGEISDLAARGPQIRQAEAQVLAADASLQTARLELERAGFALPFSGRVVDLSLAQGQKLTEGQSYGTVYSFDAIEVTVSLAPNELALLDPVIGTDAVMEVQVLGRPMTLTGKISRMAGEVDRATRLTDLIIRLDPDEVRRLQLQPGTFVSVSLAGPEIPGVAEVPNAALQDEDRLWHVDGDTLRQIDVTVVSRGRNTSLLTGVPDGARIAVGIVPGATDGITVHFNDRPGGTAPMVAQQESEQ